MRPVENQYDFVPASFLNFPVAQKLFLGYYER